MLTVLHHDLSVTVGFRVETTGAAVITDVIEGGADIKCEVTTGTWNGFVLCSSEDVATQQTDVQHQTVQVI